MELDVGDNVCGHIWQRKLNADKEEGLLIKVKHSMLGSSSGPSRSVRFMKTCFDSTSDRFIAVDHLGYIFLFDISKNRYALLQKAGQICTAVAFNHRKREFIIGLGDCSLKCFDTVKREVIAEMKGHKSPVHSISVDMSGNYALTTSSDTAHLWNLNTFEMKHKLHIKEDVDLLQAFFLPNSNTVLTCFCDDTIFAWNLDSMNCKFQLPVPSGTYPHYRAFATSQDSRYLVAGGKSCFLHLWHLNTKKLIRVIEMPTKVKAIKQLEFLNYSYRLGIDQMLGAIAHDGILRFINIDTCKMLFCIGSADTKILQMAFGPSGHHIVTVMEDGNFHIYSIDALRADLDKPAPLLMKVAMNGSKLSDTLINESSMGKAHSLQKSSRSESRALNQGELDDVGPNCEGLNKEKLLTILKGFGEYPAKYRMFIWHKILQLPDNFSAYATLVDKGAHPAYSKLHEEYPIKSHKLLRVLQRILSALAHWSPIFGETQFLPSFVFPFVRLYQNNHLVCFELIATIIVNWSQYWFEYFPNPPINVLGMIENLLAHHDLQLLQHFVKCGVTSQIYAWPLLETVFSEVLTQEEWLMLWDNILSNHPVFLLLSVVAYNICAHGSLMKCSELDDFQFFFHHRNSVSIKQVASKAYNLMEASPSNIHPQDKMDYFVPLTKGNYPVFNKYPKFIVDFQVQERERIRQEEVEYLRQKNLALDVHKETLQKHEEEEQCYRQHKLMLEAEDKRKRMIQEEESKLAEQRKRLLAMNHAAKLKELAVLEASRRKFLQFQKEEREMRLRSLNEELQRTALQRDQETETAIQEAEIKNIELQLQKNLFEQKMEMTEEGYDTDSARKVVKAGNNEYLSISTNKELLVSFERNRCAFDEKEASLLHEVRLLRQRLAKDSRNKRPPFPEDQE